MTAQEIRQQFLDFFASKGHKIIPSAPLVAKNDPTLLFVNSGMAPLKDYFLGNETPPSTRIADTQKCLRVSGKHNDLEDVGIDGYHHTLFEMLGNWSFGDYFKEEAIAWSWELLTDVFKIPKDRLYVSVFEGDEKDGLPFDQEAFDFWKQHIAEDRILAFNKKDNFWEMGEMGPCGPCSEIHVDLRSDAERAKVNGRSLVNADDPNVIEVWNNVFMQFNRKADGSLEELPAKSVDTGMGFERLVRAVQGKESNYDTDVFMPFIQFLEQLSGFQYKGTYPGIDADPLKTDIAMRVVADHLRAVCFTIADGEIPSNNGAGYVIRRILRRAVRYYYSFLNLQQPVLYKMVDLLVREFGKTFPEIAAQKTFIAKVVQEEEKAFLRTLESGLKRIDSLEVAGNNLEGKIAFELFDTFGFPIDLTRLIAAEKGWKVDDVGFAEALEAQKVRSRAAAEKSVGDWVVVGEDQPVEFLGYETMEVGDARVTKYRVVEIKKAKQYQIVLDRTPFYAESGGQVGDTGHLQFGGDRVLVMDTQKENNLIIHVVDRLPDNLEVQVVATVDEDRRQAISKNHSAVHLMHAALHEILGTHAVQKGQNVDDKRLRFDFSHYQKVTEEELTSIEQRVNQKIRENIALLEQRDMDIEAARATGAMMLFGEKYGEKVRMITFDASFSQELCGGTHVAATGQIGLFKIIGEGAVAAGIRRLEAVTALEAEQFVATELGLLDGVRQMLKNPKDLYVSVASLLEENKQLKRDVEKMVLEQAHQIQTQLLGQAKQGNGFQYMVVDLPLNDAGAIKNLLFNLDAQLAPLVVVATAIINDKPQIAMVASKEVVEGKKVHAGNQVRAWAKHIQGGGGGQPFFATAGGNNSDGLAMVRQEAEAWLKSL